VTDRIIDPVCGMTVDPARAAGSVDHHGTTYYFCSKGCVEKFKANPDRFLSGTRPPSLDGSHSSSGAAGAASPQVLTISGLKKPAAGPAPSPPPSLATSHPSFGAAGPAATRYTCPMHPEVVSDRPGACPKCGMALEPIITGAADVSDAPNPELVDMTRRFWTGIVFGAPVFLLAMGDMATGQALSHRIGMARVNLIQMALATPVVWWCGWPFFERMWQSLVHRSPNMFTLIGLGVGAAYGYSVAATVAPGIFPAGFQVGGAVGALSATAVETYFDTTVVITVLVLLGQVMELRARYRTGAAIRALLGLAPKTARRVRDGREEDIPLADVQVGDVLRVRPGEKIPVDGVVVEGTAAVDESMISGESIPVDRRPGDRMIGSTLVVNGTLLMRADRIGADTVLAQIVRMVGEAQRTRAPIQRLADRVAEYFVPAVVLSAILTFVAWSVWGPEPRFAHALVNAVAVLIIACPCALGLATPMAIMVGTGEGARSGVLIKNAEALELLGRVDTLVVDKTGTLTEGRPKVMTIDPVADISEKDLLGLAAAVERGSEHPLAAAIVSAAEERGIPVPPASDFSSETGKGVDARVEGRRVNLGNADLMKSRGIDPTLIVDRADALRRDGQTVLIVAVDGRVAGLLAVADPIRPTTADAVRRLKEEGLHLVMLTGDNRITAEAVARRLGIDDVRAEVLPADKRNVIVELQHDGHRVGMAGDGINDAPALAQADVGIAMGTGADVALESAGITLIQSDLAGVVRARRLSRATLRNIRQNLFLAFVYNTLGVPIAAGVLSPFGGPLISPVWASAAMTLSSLSVIGNALRLRGKGQALVRSTAAGDGRNRPAQDVEIEPR
jgi:Cu+-exporting ATPase